MDFPDFPFKSVQSYTHHSQVLKYLYDYMARFSLESYIHFEHHLTKVIRDHEKNCWLVSVHDFTTDQESTLTFDVVVLCPGRYCSPKWPNIDSITQFTGSIIHSHDYRSREPYTAQRVAVIGAGPSGSDITLEMSSVANKVIFINCSSVQYPNLPENVQQIKGTINKFTERSMFVQVNDQVIEFELDSVILATGYRLCLNYLDQNSCGLKLNSNDTLDGIYRHMINIQYPSMALLSICKPTLSFPLYHQQVC